MRDGNQIHAQKLGESRGIDFVGFDLSVGDGFDVFGMGQDQIDAVFTKQIAEPIPIGSRFDDGPVLALQTEEKLENPSGIVGHFALFDHTSVFMDRGYPRHVLVQIDTGVIHDKPPGFGVGNILSGI